MTHYFLQQLLLDGELVDDEDSRSVLLVSTHTLLMVQGNESRIRTHSLFDKNVG